MITWAFQVIILITFGHLIGLHEFVRDLIKNLSYSASPCSAFVSEQLL